MINTFRYGGIKQTVKDGVTIKSPISPRIILAHSGPFIDVQITHPRVVQEQFKSQVKQIPIVAVRALIDTGACSSVISPRVADDLGLIHTGYQKVTSVQDEQERPVYFGFIIFPWGSGKEIPIVSCPIKNVDCLIGRDILMHWHLSYNGQDGSIVVCD